MLVSTEDGGLATASKGIITLRGTSGAAGACKVTEHNGRINVFFPHCTCEAAMDLCDRVCVHGLIAQAEMPDGFARAMPDVGSSEPGQHADYDRAALPDPGQHADYDSGTEEAVTASCGACGISVEEGSALWTEASCYCSEGRCMNCCLGVQCCSPDTWEACWEERRLAGVCLRCATMSCATMCFGFCHNELCHMCCREVGCCGLQQPSSDEVDEEEVACRKCGDGFESQLICPCGFCVMCCEVLCLFYGTKTVHWHQDSSLCECWPSGDDDDDEAPVWWFDHNEDPAAAEGEGTQDDPDLEERMRDAPTLRFGTAQICRAANTTQGGVAAAAGEDTKAMEDWLRQRQQAGFGDAEAAMAHSAAYHARIQQAVEAVHFLLDEHGREVFGSDRSAVMAMFINEGGVVTNSSAAVPVYIPACSLMQLRRQNELQRQPQHQHQNLSRPAGPGRWQPTHMLCGAFYTPDCEHCYREACEGECLEDDVCMHGW